MSKFDSWMDLKNMSNSDAAMRYAEIVNKLVSLEDSSREEKGLSINQNMFKNLIFPRSSGGISSLRLREISLEISDGIVNLKLNRIPKKNAMNLLMWNELREIFQAIERDESVRVIIISGSGGNFSSGLDTSIFLEMRSTLADVACESKKREALKEFIRYLQLTISAIERCRVPVIASITGICFGGALDLVAACDLVYCSSSARFSLKEIDLAIVADLGSIQRLIKAIGLQRTLELAYTGELVF